LKWNNRQACYCERVGNERTGLDVLIVGAGPTGLSLAAQLTRFGTRFRIVDELPDRRHESRALAVQARSLEILDTIDLADSLVEKGRRAMRVRIHVGGGGALIPVADIGRPDTRFPFVLFVSQAETEAVLADWLARHGIEIERACRAEISAATDREPVACQLTHALGQSEAVAARYVVGCDGAHSTVRRAAALSFEGEAYPQRFMLADLEIDGPLEPDAANVFPGVGGGVLVLPLGVPRTWRLIAVVPGEPELIPDAAEPTLAIEELQRFVDRVVGSRLRLRDPAWLTRFRLHHRQVDRYRRGRLFVAGDAAHIHSPAGGQGMNTGIQDAWNLGWKLGLVCRGQAPEKLLDSYHDERWPVGRYLLRFTDRLFAVAARALGAGPIAAGMRNLALRAIVPALAASPSLRQRAFHRVSQLGIRYRRSPAVQDGIPHLAGGPQAGDRMPNLPVLKDGVATTIHELIGNPTFHVLWCATEIPSREVGSLVRDRPIALHHLNAVVDSVTAATLERLGVAHGASALYLVRPDGHIAYRCSGTNAGELAPYLDEWLPRPTQTGMPTASSQR
jgi:2-polyprenyl-6-methoxyphenol hydroxylase-like FAD-dependent oxidoreductase